MQPIICTELMELIHIDYIEMEVTVATDKKPIGEECACGCRPFYMVCASIRDQEPYGKDNSQSAVQQLFLHIWLPPMPHVGPGNRILWKSYCGYVQPTGCRENPDNPIPPSDQVFPILSHVWVEGPVTY